MLRVDLSVGDLAETHFAISPLFETVAALRALRDPGRHAFHLPWVRWAHTELEQQPLALPRLWPLLVQPHHQPEALLPAPETRLPSLSVELERLTATSPARVRGSLRRTFGDRLPEAAQSLAARPRTELRLLAQEIAVAFDRLLRPYWSRMRSLLESDITYRTRALAEAGAARMFADLHPRLSWQSDHLLLFDEPPGTGQPGPAWKVALGPGGLVLVPSVFIWPEVFIKSRTSTRTTIRYPTRGIALLWDDSPEPTPGALTRLLGRRRAELIKLLQAPHHTRELAQRTGVSDAAISQHLSVLRQAGLVTTTQLGRNRLHATSQLGRELLAQTR